MNQKEAAYFMGAKSTNPKDLLGMKKIPYHLFPATAIVVGCLQMLDGGGKYGRENYRKEGVCASVYYDANRRHMEDWFHGEDFTKDTKLMHLGGALASVAILIDATINDKLIDDRAYTNKFPELVAYATREVKRLTEMHKDKQPVHYSKLLIGVKNGKGTKARVSKVSRKRK